MRSPFDLPPSLLDDILEYTKLPAEDDHLGWFVYDFENDLKFDDHHLIEAAECGDLGALRYVRGHGYTYTYDFIPWDRLEYNRMMFSAVRKGQTEVLKFLHEDGCRIGWFIVEQAAACNCACLKYAYENHHNYEPHYRHFPMGPPLPMEETVYDEAMMRVHAAFEAAKELKLDCLQYLYGQDPTSVRDVRVVRGLMCYNEGDRALECLEFLHAHGCLKHWGHMSWAARKGNIACLRYMHENGWPWDQKVILSAAEGSSVECMKYAHENGCPWVTDVLLRAAEGGSVECLRYAHENGCPWVPEVMLSAAKGGSLECMKYAHENDCPWHRETCIKARDMANFYKFVDPEKRYHACFMYARTHGCL